MAAKAGEALSSPLYNLAPISAGAIPCPARANFARLFLPRNVCRASPSSMRRTSCRCLSS
eukprot:4470041-Pleurochrysis_carterae.AAC.1